MSDDLTIAYMMGVEDMRSRLHKQADEIERLREGLKEALDEAAQLRKENEQLRKDLKTAIMGDSAELADAKREIIKLTSAYKNGYHEALEAAAELAFKILTEIEGIDFEVPAKIRELHAAAIRESGE